MVAELTITIKGQDSTYKQKHLVYEEFRFIEDDPIIRECIYQSLENAKIEPEDIKIRAMLQVK